MTATMKRLSKKTWVSRDSNGCEFVATMLGSEEGKRYFAFGGKISASSLVELKQMVGVLP